jgi:hypothetical protein
MTHKPSVALFIDAENASSKYVEKIMNVATTLGTPTHLRCYGSAESLKKWQTANAENFILPILTMPSASKENASDFALVIDVVSLLHRQKFDRAVIASSDADFIQLAVHLRENGIIAHGVGEHKAPQELKAAYAHFHVLNIPKKAPAPAAKVVQPVKKSSPPKVVAPAVPAVSRPVPRELLDTTFLKLAVVGDVSLSVFGKTFRATYPTVPVGKGKFKKMLIELGYQINGQHIAKV